MVPSDAFLTLEWRHYLDTVRSIVRQQSGVIAYEDTPLAKPPLQAIRSLFPQAMPVGA